MKCIVKTCKEYTSNGCKLKKCKVSDKVREHWENDIRYLKSVNHIDNDCIFRNLSGKQIVGELMPRNYQIKRYGKVIFYDCEKRVDMDRCLFPDYIKNPNACRYYKKE